jgi:hypothetical protein
MESPNSPRLLIIFFDIKGILHKEFVLADQTVNSTYYRNILRWLKLKLICDRQSVGQFDWVSGLPMWSLTRCYLVLLFSADNYLIILPKASSLTRRRVCSLQWNHSLVPINILYCLIWDCAPFLSPLTTRRDYGGSIENMRRLRP